MDALPSPPHLPHSVPIIDRSYLLANPRTWFKITLCKLPQNTAKNTRSLEFSLPYIYQSYGLSKSDDERK